MEKETILRWTFMNECPLPDDANEILVDGEVAVAAYKTCKESAIFTNKRLIFRDAAGISEKKIENYSLPYASISMWSTENHCTQDKTDEFAELWTERAGNIAEIALWTCAGYIKLNIKKGIDIKRFDKILSDALLK